MPVLRRSKVLQYCPGSKPFNIIRARFNDAAFDLANSFENAFVTRRFDAELFAFLDDQAVHEIDFRTPPLENVLTHGGPLFFTAGFTVCRECVGNRLKGLFVATGSGHKQISIQALADFYPNDYTKEEIVEIEDKCYSETDYGNTNYDDTGNHVRDFHCSKDGKAVWYEYECEKGCAYGACKGAPNVNYYTD